MVQLLLSLTLAFALQTAAAPAPPQAPVQVPARAPQSATQAPYLVGPSDVLGVKVFNEADLTSQYNVDSDGAITFPYLGRVSVSGKTVQEIETILQAGLRDGYVKQAQVSVDITNYRSRSIYVLGEVKQPGEYKISGPLTLLELIGRAGSLTSTAGPIMTVQRHKDGIAATAAASPALPGEEKSVELMRIAFEDLREGRVNANILLQDGDTIFVPSADRFFVSGFVKTPGMYVLTPGLTVQQAISLAGGLTERGSNRGVKISRKVNGKDVEIGVKMSDLVKPNDTIKVRQRLI